MLAQMRNNEEKKMNLQFETAAEVKESLDQFVRPN